jgi:hypothetical protein
MDRAIVQIGANPLDTDILGTNRNAMVGLGVALQAILGGGPYVSGLPCIPGAGLTVSIGPGSIYTTASIDATQYGSMAADTVDQIIQQGILFGQNPLSTPAPATAGQSINYLIEAQFQQVDENLVALKYYSSSNPLQPFTGSATNTTRAAVCALQVKAGAAATTSTQTTPAADAGWSGIYVVTVAHGETSIVNGNIALAPGAPFIAAGLGNFLVCAGSPNGQLAGIAGVVGSTFPSVAWDITTGTLWVCITSGASTTAVWARSSPMAVYAGNPNGNVTGTAGVPGGASPSLTWDSTDSAIWICTTGGSASTAVWSPLTNLSTVNPSVTGGSYAYGQSDFGKVRVRSNSGAAMTDTFATGLPNGWWTEVINGDATAGATINVPSGKNMQGVLNGVIVLAAGQTTSVSCDATGNFWQTITPIPKITSVELSYVNSNQALPPGQYAVDTSSAAITITLEASISAGDNYRFLDFSGTFATNNLNLNPNGKTIQGLAGNFAIDVSGLDLRLNGMTNNWLLR